MGTNPTFAHDSIQLLLDGPNLSVRVELDRSPNVLRFEGWEEGMDVFTNIGRIIQSGVDKHDTLVSVGNNVQCFLFDDQTTSKHNMPKHATYTIEFGLSKSLRRSLRYERAIDHRREGRSPEESR